MKVRLWFRNTEYYSVEEYALAIMNDDTEGKYVIANLYPCEDDRINNRNEQAGFVFEKSSGYDNLCNFIKNFIDTSI